MPRRCCEFVDSRLRRSPPDRASAVPYGQAGENAMRFPHLAHRSAAAHKLHSATATTRYESDSGKGETFSRHTSLSLFSPEAVQTTGTAAFTALSEAIAAWLAGTFARVFCLLASGNGVSSESNYPKCRKDTEDSSERTHNLHQSFGEWSNKSLAINFWARGTNFYLQSPVHVGASCEGNANAGRYQTSAGNGDRLSTSRARTFGIARPAGSSRSSGSPRGPTA
jgi:hypothetical protein